jgi:ABC-2 type transport system ATP-binding protein
LEEVVQFEETVKDYGSKEIGPLTFSVGRGEIVGLLGPNGAGKSTSIRLMLGLIRPSRGRVLLMGLDPLRRHVKALERVGYSPELANLQAFMTPSEFLELVGKMVGLGRGQLKEQVDKTLEDVGLTAYENQKIGKLSKGMVQRLSVAQAMIGQPSLLVLDEPMIGIDPAGVVHFRSLFRRFVSDGGTIIMSSHILSEVETLCNTLTIIHSGRLVFRGEVKEFIQTALKSRLIEVELQPFPDDLLVEIQGISGVVKATRMEGGYLVEAASGSDPRSEIAKLVVESGARLLSIGYSRGELDEAYIAAIKGSGN